jgi:C_GCAxxG_C_C family probable redox protein
LGTPRLSKLIEDGFSDRYDLNCAESILYGANQVYGLGLDKNALKLAAGFGGGVGIEAICGALTGSVMVIGRMYTEDRAHASPRVKELAIALIERFRREMGEIDCTPLKEKYRTEELKCRRVILKAAQILEDIILEEQAR